VKKSVIYIAGFCFCVMFAVLAAASSAFVVKAIHVKGLQRITRATFDSYLPIAKGESFSLKTSDKVIQDLYKTGFFKDIKLYREGNILVVRVLERPTIGVMRIKGNEQIKTKKLKTSLKMLGIEEGRVYNRAIVEEVQKNLEHQYFNLGYYNVNVKIDVGKEARNRIALNITIREGGVAIIRGINIIGNKQFSESTLRKHFSLSTPGLLSYFNQKDRYSREKLDADLQSLSSFYMDRGYINYKLLSTEVSITPDKQNVYITLSIKEGAQFRLSGVKFSGKTILPKTTLKAISGLRVGTVFSRQEVVKANHAIQEALGEKGYAFAKVVPGAKIDEKKHQVLVSYNITPMKRVYVRKIHFVGNYQTNDEVLRRQLRIFEGELSSTSKIKESKRLLSQLPYVKNVNIRASKLSAMDNQVDVDVKVQETHAGNVMAGVGYSQLDGAILNATLNKKNILGTGREIDVKLQRGGYSQSYTFSYTNPYYTKTGISRTMSFYAERTDPGNANQLSNYTTNDYGLSMSYNIPMYESINSSNSLNVGFSLQNTLIHLGFLTPDHIVEFTNRFGRRYNEGALSIGWLKNNFDRFFMPIKGYQIASNLQLSLPLDHDSFGFYLMNVGVKAYYPLYDGFIFKTRANLGYGGGFTRSHELPFFRNYFEGGMGSVRGYIPGSLGPKDSFGFSAGGDTSMSGSIGLIFPNGFSPDHLRTSVYLDAGNAFDSFHNKNNGGIDFSKIRYAVGLGAQWVSPFGILDFAFSKGLHVGPEHTQVFNFSVGANF
jgi:outer membrane protein insertion porin family